MSAIYQLTSLGLPKDITKEIIHDAPTAKRALHTALLLVKIAKNALVHFLNQDYMQFNALVADTSCQIRASKQQKLALQASDLRKSLEAEIKKTHAVMICLEEALKKEEVPTNSPLICEYLGKVVFACDNLNITKDMQFLVLSHLLTLTRDAQNPLKTCEGNLNSLLGKAHELPLDRCVKIVRYAKSQLSVRSVEYVREIARTIPKAQGDSKALVDALSKGNIKEYVNLQISPCLFNLQTILCNVRQTKSLLLLKVHRYNSLGQKLDRGVLMVGCVVSNDGITFQRLKPSTLNGPAIVIEGLSKTAKPLCKKGYSDALLGEKDALASAPHSRVIQIILANAAAHPQYAGEKLRGVKPKVAGHLAELADAMEKVANLQGFCDNNPTLFSIKHIYCNSVENERMGSRANPQFVRSYSSFHNERLSEARAEAEGTGKTTQSVICRNCYYSGDE